MNNRRLSFLLLLLVSLPCSLLAQFCPPDEQYPYLFCKNGELVRRCSNDPHHVWEDGIKLIPFKRTVPGCLTIEQRQGLDIYMPTAVTGDSEEYTPVFLADHQAQDVTSAFNQWANLCPPSDDHDCCAHVYFSSNIGDFFDDPDNPGYSHYIVSTKECKPTCDDQRRLYVNASPEWFYKSRSPEPTDDLIRAFYTGSRPPNILPGYEAFSLYQFMEALTGTWFGMLSATGAPETQGCSHPNSVMENPLTYDSPINLTPDDICQFKKLYCDREVGLGVEDETEKGGLSLSQNIPNPFNALTTIPYSLVKPGNVRLSLFDATGKEIKTLIDQHMEAGIHTFGFHASDDMPPGTYWYVLQVDNVTRTRQMILIK